MEQHKVFILDRDEVKTSLSLEDYYDIDKKMSKPGFKTLDGKFNWHCSCVSSYVGSPCGYIFRKFLANMDRFMGADNGNPDEKARAVFQKCYSDLTVCMNKYPTYYQPILEQYESTLQEVFTEEINS